MSDVKTSGDALRRLEESLKSTNVLSKDYTSHVLAWAYKAVELAHKQGHEEARAGIARAIRKEDSQWWVMVKLAQRIEEGEL
jgi:hypothetical protein